MYLRKKGLDKGIHGCCQNLTQNNLPSHQTFLYVCFPNSIFNEFFSVKFYVRGGDRNGMLLVEEVLLCAVILDDTLEAGCHVRPMVSKFKSCIQV